jgi:hypothetical protein
MARKASSKPMITTIPITKARINHGQYRLRLGRWHFRYDISGREVKLTITAQAPRPTPQEAWVKLWGLLLGQKCNKNARRVSIPTGRSGVGHTDERF